MKQLSISFIIPAYNEESALPKVLKSINEYTPSMLSYEVIVADNGSQDNTVNVAHDCNARVLVDENATVGGLRNLAVSKSSGRVLVFLDADMLLTEAWSENIAGVYETLIENPWQITGSRCGLPESASWIERYWFRPLLTRKEKYINSGHLITTFELFDHIGGFDDSLETGEDYALSQAALAVNATITNNPSLAVVHEGYPKTLFQFIRREIWHGRGDCESVSAILASNVAKASLLFMGLHVLFLTVFVWFPYIMTGVSGALMIVSVCMVFAVHRHGVRSIRSLFIVSTLYYFYFLSRFLSCIPLAGVGLGKKRHKAASTK